MLSSALWYWLSDVQEIEANPIKIFPFSLLPKINVGPWLSHLLWKLLQSEPSLVPR